MADRGSIGTIISVAFPANTYTPDIYTQLAGFKVHTIGIFDSERTHTTPKNTGSSGGVTIGGSNT